MKCENFVSKLPNLNVAVNVEYYYKYSCDGSDDRCSVLEFISKGFKRFGIDIRYNGIQHATCGNTHTILDSGRVGRKHRQ